MTRHMTQLLLFATSVALLLGTSGAANAAGNDYPWRTDTSQSADRWGFTKRQCVSFVAWRMAQRGHRLDNATQKWGSALTWDDTARRLGYGIGAKPVAGSIAQWNAGETSAYYAKGATTANGLMKAGPYGHVGYVQGVYSDGSVSVVQYNMSGDRAYSTVRVKAPRYLYVSVATPR